MASNARHVVPVSTVGGAAATPIDPSVRIAPLRDLTHIGAAERRAATALAEPWDPWPPQRVGYQDPSGNLLFPAADVLDRLRQYLDYLQVKERSFRAAS